MMNPGAGVRIAAWGETTGNVRYTRTGNETIRRVHRTVRTCADDQRPVCGEYDRPGGGA